MSGAPSVIERRSALAAVGGGHRGWRLGRSGACPVERWVEATSSPRAQIGAILVKLFAADSERRSTSFVTDERRLPFGIQNKNRTAIPGTMRSDDGGPLSYVV